MVTGKAKAAIRRYVRACKRDQFITLGQEILERLFKGENLEFSEKGLVNVLQNFEAESIEDIYAKVGEGLVTGWDVLKAVYPAYKQSKLEKVVKSIKVPSFKRLLKRQEERTAENQRAYSGNGGSFCRLLSPAAGRSHCRYCYYRQGGCRSYH